MGSVFCPRSKDVVCPTCGAVVTVTQVASWANPVGRCQCGRQVFIVVNMHTGEEMIQSGDFVGAYGLKPPESDEERRK